MNTGADRDAERVLSLSSVKSTQQLATLPATTVPLPS